MRRRLALVLLLLFTFCGAAFARQAVNYQIREVGYQLSDGQVEVQFTVINSGGAVNAAEQVYLFDSTGNQLTTGSIPPLIAGGKTPRQELAVALDQFLAGSRQTFYIVVGSDQLPPENQRNQLSNVTVQIPDTIVVPAATAQVPAGGVVLPGGFVLDLNNTTTLVEVLAVIVVAVLLLWVLTVILRLLFSRSPTLPAWQPPYVITPLIDPNSTNGRRQLWQQHAESDTLPQPCVPGNYMVRKLLIGSSGAKLAGWRVTGLRISQYDRYGRVARSQTVLPKKAVKALDKAVRRSASLSNWDKALKASRPVARALSAAYLKKARKQSATLPVAVDIRFVGMHGEVRIVFELYGCNGSVWQEIDHWEPEMRVVNGSIHENFTYTLFGQYPEETYKQFRKRFEGDLNHALAALVQAPPPPPVSEDTSETSALSI